MAVRAESVRVENPFLVRVRGEVDADTAPRTGRELARALAEHREVVLDLSEVTFMDCAGLRVLLAAGEQADRTGARLVLRGAGRPVTRLLELTGLDLAGLERPGGARPRAGRSGAERSDAERSDAGRSDAGRSRVVRPRAVRAGR
ncbi:STAS domain-containing protein [Kitasatospora sp. NPDC001540]|uniref:STAS domain-containing protein n=1 Tax=Kitasatospora sp. NPDC001540 TaxID=3364014 RepID=UPI0036D0C877